MLGHEGEVGVCTEIERVVSQLRAVCAFADGAFAEVVWALVKSGQITGAPRKLSRLVSASVRHGRKRS